MLPFYLLLIRKKICDFSVVYYVVSAGALHRQSIFSAVKRDMASVCVLLPEHSAPGETDGPGGVRWKLFRTWRTQATSKRRFLVPFAKGQAVISSAVLLQCVPPLSRCSCRDGERKHWCQAHDTSSIASSATLPCFAIRHHAGPVPYRGPRYPIWGSFSPRIVLSDSHKF